MELSLLCSGEANTGESFFILIRFWSEAVQVFTGLIYLQEKVQNALKLVLEETRNTKNPCKVMLSVGDFEKMSVLVELLCPIMEATDVLQGDTVTSSAVIPSISCAYKCKSHFLYLLAMFIKLYAHCDRILLDLIFSYSGSGCWF